MAQNSRGISDLSRLGRLPATRDPARMSSERDPNSLRQCAVGTRRGESVDGPMVPLICDRGPYCPLNGPRRVDAMDATQNLRVDPGNLISFDDGTKAVVRPITSADSGALMRFHDHLSAKSIQLRYFSPHKDLSPSEVAHFTQVDGEARVALVVERARELIAVGRYDRLDDHRLAEVAFVVADAYQAPRTRDHALAAPRGRGTISRHHTFRRRGPGRE